MHEPEITFSLVVTFYNQREFVSDALDSVLALDLDNVEIIAVDDASSDGTADALHAYADRVALVLLQENHGASGARNRGAAEATGDYLVFLDGDDALLPWAFDVYETVARTRRPTTMIGSLIWFAGELPAPGDEPDEIEYIEYPDYFAKDRSLGAWAGATVIDARAFREIGGFAPELRICEDYDLMWRLGTSGRVAYITTPATALHRAHARQGTRQATRIFAAVRQLVEFERSGRYPGRGIRALERKACVGGCVLFWALTLRHGFEREAASSLLRSVPMVAAAAIVRLRTLIRGRRPARKLRLKSRRGVQRANA